MNEDKVLELVVFQLKNGVTDEAFLETTGAANDWIKTQPGYISEDLVLSDDGGTWIEVVWWNSLAEAKAAAEKAMTSEACTPMFSKIQFEGIVMHHAYRSLHF